MYKLISFIGVLLTFSISVLAQDIAFVTCPIVRDTDPPCWFAEHNGELYYLGVQQDTVPPVEFYPPQFGHKILVEATGTGNGQVCGGTPLQSVRISVLRELDPSCREILPPEGYTPPPTRRKSGPPATGVKLAVDLKPTQVEGDDEFSTYSRIGKILDNPEAKSVLVSYWPNAKSAQIRLARRMSLRDISKYDNSGLTKELLEEIDKGLETMTPRTDTAVHTGDSESSLMETETDAIPDTYAMRQFEVSFDFDNDFLYLDDAVILRTAANYFHTSNGQSINFDVYRDRVSLTDGTLLEERPEITGLRSERIRSIFRDLRVPEEKINVSIAPYPQNTDRRVIIKVIPGS